MKSLKCIEEQNDFKEYEKIFSRLLKAGPKAESIMSLQVREPEKSTYEIVLTLWDGTETMAIVPGCFSGENESFIVFYTNNVVSPSLIGQDPLQQMSKIDDILYELLEETVHLLEKSSLKKLAGNVSWAVSVAVCKAGARCRKISVCEYLESVDYNPKSQSDSEDCGSEDEDFRTKNFRTGPHHGLSPAFNISNGVLDLEENFTKQLQHIVIIPNYPYRFHRGIEVVREIYQDLKNCYAIDYGGEEIYTPSFHGIKKCLTSVTTTIDKLGYREEVSIGVKIGDQDDKTCLLNFEDEASIIVYITSGDDLVDFYVDVALNEDPFHVNDKEFSSKLVVLENDGIFVESESVDSESFGSDHRAEVFKSQLLKVDQLGTVKKCIQVVSQCKSIDLGTIMCSHYSCGTSDPFIADLCVALKLDQLKIGISCITGPCQTCKRVAEIEMERR